MSALAAIHTGLRQLGIADDDKRDFYQRLTGKRSLTEMSKRDQDAVLGELRRLGFKPREKVTAKGLQGPYAKKLQAQWIAMWNLGIVADRTDAALTAFVKRQTGLDHTRFLRDPQDARKAVEALKGWMAREGGVAWGSSQGYDWLQHDPGKVAWAQFRLLFPGATLMGNRADFTEAVGRALCQPVPLAGLGSLSPSDWRMVMNAFGDRIRKQTAAE